jgi:glycosyltransferase involved in cell wall biosynthesis
VRIVILSADVVKKSMAGPGIRCYEFARSLSKHFEVTLGIPNAVEIDGEEFNVVRYGDGVRDIERLAEKGDVLLLGHLDIGWCSFLFEFDKPIIVDVYSPSNLEMLEWYSYLSLSERIQYQERATEILNNWMRIGDFFMCSSERQRAYWLGMLAANYRLRPNAYDEDRTFRNILDVVPFGLAVEPPSHTNNVLKGRREGIDEKDILLIWAGGIWNWLDPLTCIRAVAALAKQRKDIKLFFMGKGHPNSKIPEMKMFDDAVQLSKDLGVYERQVFFNDGWVPYEDRSSYLLESEIGVCGHFDNIETEFSFRTRILDYLWAGLPIISTEGDEMAELIRQHGLGEVVHTESVEDVEKAIIKLSDPEYRSVCHDNIRKISGRFSWDRVVEPIVRFCENPVKLECRGNGSNVDKLDKAAFVSMRTLEGRVRRLEEAVNGIQGFLRRILSSRAFRAIIRIKRGLSWIGKCTKLPS